MTSTAPEFTIPDAAVGDPLQLLAKEWLVTNGVGGYASGSLLGVATRRYHGVFVPDLPGRGRTMIVPRLDETVEQGATGCCYRVPNMLTAGSTVRGSAG